MLDAAAPLVDNRVYRIFSAAARVDARLSAPRKRFMVEHTSAGFWRRIVAAFGAEMRERYPGLEQRVGKPMEAWKAGRRGDSNCDIALECLLVINSPVRSKASAVKGLHIDRADKLWTGLLYMRADDDDWVGGGLELYSAPAGLRFDKHQAPRSEVRFSRRIAYGNNVFVGFVNSVDAVYAVQRREPTPHVRRCVDFVAELPSRHAFDVPQMGRLRRSAFRLFGRREATR